MTLIKKKSEDVFILNVKVKTNANNQKIFLENNANYFQINLISKPIQNRANKELLKLLKKKLRININQIQLISGIKSKRKLIQVTYYNSIDEKEILKKLLK